MIRGAILAALAATALISIASSAETPPPLLNSWPSARPSAVAVDINANVYVLSLGNATVTKYDNSGNLITEWGSVGNGDEQMDHPSGIAVSADGRVYVADAYNNRVQIFTVDGEHLDSWDIPFPQDVAIDPEGRVYSISRGIVRFNRDPTGYTLLIEQLAYGSLAIDAQGAIFASAGHPAYRKVQKISQNGAVLEQWDLPAFPLGIGVNRAGDVFVSFNDGHIRKYDQAGGLLLDWPGFYEPVAIETDLNENIYLADRILQRVYQFGLEPPPVDVGTARLSWDGCDPLVRNKDYPGPANARIVCSIAESSVPNTGHQTEIHLRPGSEAGFPDAWRFDVSGCQTGRLQVTNSAVSKACLPYQGSNVFMFSEYTYDETTNEATLLISGFYDAFTADPARRYTLWRADLDLTGTNGTDDSMPGACGAAGDPLCVTVVDIGITTPAGAARIPLESEFITWNDPSGAMGCPGAVQNVPVTWGRLKGLYR